MKIPIEHCRRAAQKRNFTAVTANVNYAAAKRWNAGITTHCSGSSTNGQCGPNPQAVDGVSSVEHEGKRSPSPKHLPKTDSVNEDLYVLTFLTNKAHHERMTDLRNKYFPKHLNKLAAHMTLFHALPGSKLENSIIPVIRFVTLQTAPFQLHACKAFRLKRGIAISIARHVGGQRAQEVHRALQQPWLKEGFLSDQDAGGCKVHYTIMNKVEDEQAVGRALEAVQMDFNGDYGIAEGLRLWRYNRGWWSWERDFPFRRTAPS